MSFELPHQTLLPSIGSVTGEMEIPLSPETVEEVQAEVTNENIGESIENILEASNEPLPKDVGEINVCGHLRFDEEMPPDEETQTNTIFNALMYDIVEFPSKGVDGRRGGEEEEEEEEGHVLKKRNPPKSIVFDTCSTNLDISKFQTTLLSQHPDFRFSCHSRTLMVAFNDDPASVNALNWTVQEMCNDNDIVIILHVVPLNTVIKNGVGKHRDYCNKLLKRMRNLNTKNRHIKLVVEIRIGAVEFTIARGFRDFDPNFLIMGTKGLKKTKLTSFLNDNTSLTKHFLDNGRMPVIVINPEYIPSTATYTNINEKTFVDKLKSYSPDIERPGSSQRIKLERSSSSSSIGGGSRTPRFLRLTSRSSSRTSLNSLGIATPASSTDTSPERPSNTRTSNRSRALSPFRFFHRH